MKTYLLFIILFVSITVSAGEKESQDSPEVIITDDYYINIVCDEERAAESVTCEYSGESYFKGASAVWKFNGEYVDKPNFKIALIKDKNTVELFRKNGKSEALMDTYVFYRKHVGIENKNGFKDIPNIVYFCDQSFEESIELKSPLDKSKAKVKVFVEDKLLDDSSVNIRDNFVLFKLKMVKNRLNVKLVYLEGDHKSELHMTYLRGDGKVTFSKHFDTKIAYISFVEEEIERWKTVTQEIVGDEIRNLFDGFYFVYVNGETELGKYIQVVNGKTSVIHQLQFNRSEYVQDLEFKTLDTAPIIKGDEFTYKSGTKVLFQKTNMGDSEGLSIPFDVNESMRNTLIFVIIKSKGKVEVHPFDLGNRYKAAHNSGFEVNSIVEKNSDVFISYWYIKK
ncbi:hypothetical protein [Halobacteriovorax sp.]|uniref:hypothetical protein n=1 Tax=Halobacteriovorax sp. TaxID=2020862 RepID=UPI003AF24D18